MSDLIKRLEAATEGSRELDLEIAVINGWIAPAEGERYWTAPNNQTRCYEDLVPRYTTSFDEAITLIPSGYRLDQIGEWDADDLRARGAWYAIIKRPYQKELEFGMRCNHAHTAALALCSAALKAKENIY